MRPPRAKVAVVGAAVLIAASAGSLLVRLPHAFGQFGSARAAAVGRDQLGGALAAADSADIDNDFVAAAFQNIPKNASYAVVLPQNLGKAEKQFDVNPITFDALLPMMEDFLLPRRQVSSAKPGTWVLCYYCASKYLDAHTRWYFNNQHGALVGYFKR